MSTRRTLVAVLSLVAAAALLLILLPAEGSPPRDDPWARVPVSPNHVDHKGFYPEPFADAHAVTKACLHCHPDSAKEVMATSHWNWAGQIVKLPGREEILAVGKRNLINNFCIGIQSNWPRCTSCHAGYGWKDDSFDFTNELNVDCLVCHDTTGG